MTGLPPWKARNERERKMMTNWVNRQLDNLFEAEFMEWQKTSAREFSTEKHSAWLDAFGPEIAKAEQGDIEPLRRQLGKSRFPGLSDVAKFLQRPKRKRGQRFPKPQAEVDRVRAAIDDVRRIRSLWKKHYGKQNRSAGDGPSAEQIAADRWEVAEVTVRRAKERR